MTIKWDSVDLSKECPQNSSRRLAAPGPVTGHSGLGLGTGRRVRLASLQATEKILGVTTPVGTGSHPQTQPLRWKGDGPQHGNLPRGRSQALNLRIT